MAPPRPLVGFEPARRPEPQAAARPRLRLLLWTLAGVLEPIRYFGARAPKGYGRGSSARRLFLEPDALHSSDDALVRSLLEDEPGDGRHSREGDEDDRDEAEDAQWTAVTIAAENGAPRGAISIR